MATYKSSAFLVVHGTLEVGGGGAEGSEYNAMATKITVEVELKP